MKSRIHFHCVTWHPTNKKEKITTQNRQGNIRGKTQNTEKKLLKYRKTGKNRRGQRSTTRKTRTATTFQRV